MFFIIMMFDVDQCFLWNVSFINIIQMYKNSNNEQNRESAMIIIRIMSI